MKFAQKCLFFAFCCLIPATHIAQISLGGNPFFLSNPSNAPYLSTVELPKPDITVAKQKDAEMGNPRFAVPIEVNLNPLNSGQWKELDSGDRVWWIKFRASDAEGLAIFYEDFKLLPGCRLFMFNPESGHTLGAYSNRNNKKGGRFVTGFTPGETVVLELFVPKKYKKQAFFKLFRIDYAYRDIGLPAIELEKNIGFGTSDSCHININCPEAAIAQSVKNGTCRIRMTLAEGTAWCSGSLMNNTAADGRPFVLSGFHCQDGYTPWFDLWRFDFHYAGDACENPSVEPGFQSIIGCDFRAGRQASDFILVEVSSDIPANFNVQFNGWDRSAPAPDSAYHVHHPNADIQKFSIDTNSISIHPFSINWNNGVITPANHHFRSTLDIGTFQIGSSGGPFFNTNGQVIGQLHGGAFGCDQVLTYFGRFSSSWNGGNTPQERLRDWLDPLDSGAMSIDAYLPPPPNAGTVSGVVETSEGLPIPGAFVSLTGEVDHSTFTDSSGQYLFEDIPMGINFSITTERDINITNGVTTLDMLIIQKHILGLNLLIDQPYKMLAADVNRSGTVTSIDMVFMLQAILGLIDGFPNDNNSWRFVPTDFEFPTPNPLSGPILESIEVINFEGDLEGADFIGVKVGDVNNSANPSE